MIIYLLTDWLDTGNNKKALQEAEKVLKKQPNFLCAKVLKALALQRLGREVECEEILEKVCQEVPTDEATLQAITICYRAVHKRKFKKIIFKGSDLFKFSKFFSE